MNKSYCQLSKICVQAMISRSSYFRTLVPPTIKKVVNSTKDILGFLSQKELLKLTANCSRHTALALNTSTSGQPPFPTASACPLRYLLPALSDEGLINTVMTTAQKTWETHSWWAEIKMTMAHLKVH